MIVNTSCDIYIPNFRKQAFCRFFDKAPN